MFALGYVAFYLYWKFQQENVMRKVEKGLSAKNKAQLEGLVRVLIFLENKSLRR